MNLLYPAALALLSAPLLSGCVSPTGGTISNASDRSLEVSLPLAPTLPAYDDRPHSQLQKMTGINGDAVPAILGDDKQAYIYFDLFAANKEAVPQAPKTLCAYYGKSLKSSRITESADHAPGIKVWAVQCR